ncbi:regulator of chromosome condensation, RCC1 [Micromonas commoda]|uniref:Regulator of chromosome condensation, RCC1 n=1 Tax=Micromonas commoda (strain RCC299 / NOUM17 / CCMP2709) TaxID=296587 RepID=C1FET7_MICCC|nr:regulator of chromosome condensation, RCC1 [Micromonas commoda]ACO69011.1 regulator of chromosome condensation, RCC1 [Micromonas commoda]|eukprot:XP_002507753.1 regulator of chromosome condensation, RCC1 [Micromonas commoda]
MGSDRIAADNSTTECVKARNLTSVHRAGLAATGRARICLHANSIGRLGGFVFMFIFNLMSGGADSLEISLGAYHSCALIASGKVMCWGSNGDGQLGDGTYTDRASPVEVWGISTATSIGLGGYHSCALLLSGKVMCWGWAGEGRLGDGTTNNKRTTPVMVSGITTATTIGLAHDHSCAILTDGKVMCWGYNFWGQLGDGTTTDSAIPVEVVGVRNATSIAGGNDHTCALLVAGAVACWGSNGSGQIGDGTTTQRLSPVQVSGIWSATSISLGDYHSCALLLSGKVMCWGLNGGGQLGDGTVNSRDVPVEVLGISTATNIGLGGYHSCAVLIGGKVMCWGLNDNGQLGEGQLADGSTSDDRLIPVEVYGITTATTITQRLGKSHSCAVLTEYKVMCWGSNSEGQLGDNSTSDGTPRYIPVEVDGLLTAADDEPKSERFEDVLLWAIVVPVVVVVLILSIWGYRKYRQNNGQGCFHFRETELAGIAAAGNRHRAPPPPPPPPPPPQQGEFGNGGGGDVHVDLTAGNNREEDDEVEITGASGITGALHDFPHSRHICQNLPLDNGHPHRASCPNCWCFVCEVPAPCDQWGDGSNLNADHCRATEEVPHWVLARDLARDERRARNAA